MRIAFASCMCTRVFENQPVWDWIARRQPDHLVLLGDSIYLDVTLDGVHPKDLSDNDFALRLFALYTELLAQPSFKALVDGMAPGRIWSIWDDHDFLWNDANGAVIRKQPAQRDKIPLTTAFQEAFRKALAKSKPFPPAWNSADFWNHAQPLTTDSVELAPGLWLHLSDNRTMRENKGTALGAEQRALFGQRIQGQANAVHLFATGSTLATMQQHYWDDFAWLTGLAANRRLLALTGDIHTNRAATFPTGGAFKLREATSSGAAVRQGVDVGPDRRNYGLLDIDDTDVTVSLFADDVRQPEWSSTFSRASW